MERDQLARSVLVVAAIGKMPDTFWFTDSRILLACDVLEWNPAQARQWARAHSYWCPPTGVEIQERTT